MEITLTMKQLERNNILNSVKLGLMTKQEASKELNLSLRQIYRLSKKFELEGVQALIHKNTTQVPWNKIDEQTRALVLSIYQSSLSGYNFSHATEVLNEEYGINLSRSSLSRLLKQQDIMSPRKLKRPNRHPRRKAREYEGELAQMDASQFDWLSNGTILHLHGVIDDATGKILALHLDTQETFEGYRQCLLEMNRQNLLPQNIYTDRRNIFIVESKNQDNLTNAEIKAGVKKRYTPFTKGLINLGIKHIPAYSPQAKGKIERLWNTLQDRLPKDFSRLKIDTLEAANLFLKDFIQLYNQKFSIKAAQPDVIYLSSVDQERCQILMSHRDYRTLNKALEFSFNNKRYCLSKESIKKVPDQYLLAIEIASHQDFGIRALIPQLDLISDVIEIQVTPSISQPKKSQEEISHLRSVAGKKGKQNSPWFNSSSISYFSKRKENKPYSY